MPGNPLAPGAPSTPGNPDNPGLPIGPLNITSVIVIYQMMF